MATDHSKRTAPRSPARGPPEHKTGTDSRAGRLKTKENVYTFTELQCLRHADRQQLLVSVIVFHNRCGEVLHQLSQQLQADCGRRGGKPPALESHLTEITCSDNPFPYYIWRTTDDPAELARLAGQQYRKLLFEQTAEPFTKNGLKVCAVTVDKVDADHDGSNSDEHDDEEGNEDDTDGNADADESAAS